LFVARTLFKRTPEIGSIFCNVLIDFWLNSSR